MTEIQPLLLKAFHRLAGFAARLKTFMTIRPVRIGLQLITLLFCTFYLYTNLKQINEIPAGTHFNLLSFVLSWISTLVAVFCGAAAWWLILRSMFQPAPLANSLGSHVQSNLAKYIPGFAWQIIGKAYLTRQIGVPTALVASALALEMAAVIAAGLGLVGIFYPYTLLPGLFPQPLTFTAFLIIKILLALVIFSVVIALPEIIQAVLKRPQPLIQYPVYYRLAVLILTISWLIFGLGYWQLGAALHPLPVAVLPRFIFTLSLSVIIGLLAVFAPGGIGIRESIMVYLLSPVIGGPLAVILAAISRVVILLSEVAAFLLVGAWLKFTSTHS